MKLRSTYRSPLVDKHPWKYSGNTYSTQADHYLHVPIKCRTRIHVHTPNTPVSRFVAVLHHAIKSPFPVPSKVTLHSQDTNTHTYTETKWLGSTCTIYWQCYSTNTVNTMCQSIGHKESTSASKYLAKGIHGPSWHRCRYTADWWCHHCWPRLPGTGAGMCPWWAGTETGGPAFAAEQRKIRMGRFIKTETKESRIISSQSCSTESTS